MIRTDRRYNRERDDERERRIARLEAEMDELADRMFDHPEQCTDANIRRLNYLSTQVDIMRGEMIYNVKMDY